MPFLSQPSPFIRAWNRHQETLECATDGSVCKKKCDRNGVTGKEGTPKRKFLDALKEEIGEVGGRQKDIENRTIWGNIISCGYP